MLFNHSIFDTSNLAGNSTVVDQFDCTLVPTNTSDCKEQLHLSEFSEDSDSGSNYNLLEKWSEDPGKSISSDPLLLDPLIKEKIKSILSNSQETIMANDNPHIVPIANNQVVSLRDALEVVPIFTGDNISLDQFIEECREARDTRRKIVEVILLNSVE